MVFVDRSSTLLYFYTIYKKSFSSICRLYKTTDYTKNFFTDKFDAQYSSIVWCNLIRHKIRSNFLLKQKNFPDTVVLWSFSCNLRIDYLIRKSTIMQQILLYKKKSHNWRFSYVMPINFLIQYNLIYCCNINESSYVNSENF